MLTFAPSFHFHYNIKSQCPHLLEFRVKKDVLDFKQPSRVQEEAEPDREDAAACIRHSFGDPVKAVWVLQAVNIHTVNEDDLVRSGSAESS